MRLCIPVTSTLDTCKWKIQAACKPTLLLSMSLAALHDGDLFRQVAVDACRDAITRDVRNWASAFMRGLRALGYEYTIRGDTLIPVDVANVMLLLDAPARQEWAGVDICPRTCPSENATLCTYLRWFARPEGLRQPGPLVMLPLSARCMHTLLRFRMGAHLLPVVLGRRSGEPLVAYCAGPWHRGSPGPALVPAVQSACSS